MIAVKGMCYSSLSKEQKRDLYCLRKQVFLDRLQWDVKCAQDMEYDEYDNANATYLMSVSNGTLLGSVRLIETNFINMITGTFCYYFDELNLPEGNYIESSRFFIDKERVKEAGILGQVASLSLFLSMINYARYHHYEGIVSIVSYEMSIVLRRSGWNAEVISQGEVNPGESIYLVKLPTDDDAQDRMIRKLKRLESLSENDLRKWPLTIHNKERAMVM